VFVCEMLLCFLDKGLLSGIAWEGEVIVICHVKDVVVFDQGVHIHEKIYWPSGIELVFFFELNLRRKSNILKDYCDDQCGEADYSDDVENFNENWSGTIRDCRFHKLLGGSIVWLF